MIKCIVCGQEIDIPVYSGTGFYQEGPFCVRCAQDRANAEREQDVERDLRELEMNRAMWKREDNGREERRQRHIDAYKAAGKELPHRL